MDPKTARRQCDELVTSAAGVEDWTRLRDELVGAIVDAQKRLVVAQRALLRSRQPVDTEDSHRVTEEIAQLRSVKIEVDAKLLELVSP